MTFDEVDKYIKEVIEFDGTDDGRLDLEEVDNILYLLKQGYAPTVEMTKVQYEAFFESVEGIATQEQLDSFVDGELDLGDMTIRRALGAWLHPETIKITEEKQ